MSSRTQIWHTDRVFPLLVALALAWIPTVHAQTQQTTPKVKDATQRPVVDRADSEPAPAKPADRDRLKSWVKQALPSWDEKVLQVPKTENWAAELTPRRVAEALDDRDLLSVIKEAPNGVQVFRTKGSVLRFNPEKGELRYVNRARAVDLRNDVGVLPADKEAEKIAFITLIRLGLPRGEFGDLSVATQMSGGGPIGSREMQVKAEMYRLVSVPRHVGELPVFVSKARAAVTPEGQIQRLRVKWPPLTIRPNMRLVETDKVVERAVELLVDQAASEQTKLRARLGYLPTDAKDTTTVMPVVLFNVEDAPTPFMFSVPVVEPEAGDDEKEDSIKKQ